MVIQEKLKQLEIKEVIHHLQVLLQKVVEQVLHIIIHQKQMGVQEVLVEVQGLMKI